MPRLLRWVGAVALAFALVVSMGCSSDPKTEDGGQNAGNGSSSEEQGGSGTAATPTMNIVELAQSVPSLSILVDAVIAGNLVDTLSSPGPFTVFAPTNEAFQALLDSNADWTTLSDIPTDVLVQVLTYHVVAGAVRSTDLQDGMTPTTVQGSTLRVDLSSGVKINNATVTMADVMATNGVVHVIDSVLLPPME